MPHTPIQSASYNSASPHCMPIGQIVVGIIIALVTWPATSVWSQGTNPAATTPRRPNLQFVHPGQATGSGNSHSGNSHSGNSHSGNSHSGNSQTPGQGGAGGHHPGDHGHGHHHPTENVTNNYYGYGWPDPYPYLLGYGNPGGRVTNYYNGVPVYSGYGTGFGSIYGYGYGYPYAGNYGTTWYGQQLSGSLGFPGAFPGGPLQPNLIQPNVNPLGFQQPGFQQPGVIVPGRGRAVLGGNAAALGNAAAIGNAAAVGGGPAVGFPRAIDAVPGKDAAAEIQRRVDVLKPSTPEGRARADRLIAQGDEMFSAQRYAVASARYRDAMAKAPDYPTVHFRLGHCDIASGNFELALTRFLMALELAGSAERVNFSLEQLYQGDKFAKQVHLDRLQDAILREPNDGGLVFLMGVTLHYDQQPLQARTWFVKSQSMPGAHQAYVHLFLPIVPIAEPK